MQSSTLSRTSSVASISSDDAARRTRKRFTSVQLIMLEQLFHQTSHPTREEREAVARAASMEIKSVTIWFQNKRQTERKVALYHGTGHPTDGHRTVPFPFPSSSPPTSAPAPTHPIRTPHTRTLSTSLSTTTTHAHTLMHTPRRKITPPRPRPSLDRVATRSESRLPPPRTPTKPHDPHASLWDNMPSSPLAPPASPPSRDLIEFMGSHRTLEWACAAARLAGKAGRQQPRERGHLDERDPNPERDDREGDGIAGDDTEEDDIEAVTPEGSLGAPDVAKWHGTLRVTGTRPRLPPPVFTPTSGSAPRGEWPSDADAPERGAKDVPQDEDTMRAALALCGLGRRSG